MDKLDPMIEHRRNSVPTLEDVGQAARVSRALESLVMRSSPRVSAQLVITAINDRGDLPDCVMTPRLVVRQTTAG